MVNTIEQAAAPDKFPLSPFLRGKKAAIKNLLGEPGVLIPYVVKKNLFLVMVKAMKLRRILITWPRKLSEDLGVSFQEAYTIWNNKALSGYSSVWPWVVLIGCLAAYFLAIRLNIALKYGEIGTFVKNLLFIGGVIGSMQLNFYIAYKKYLKIIRVVESYYLCINCMSIY
ncbi:hypothetical protein [Motilimonas sp. KMU-193]|uniref:hypothetical protein n=1 Tax=Motilimonas sp. KMU-193 TaxID=3388668 RepID=UPI00396B421F